MSEQEGVGMIEGLIEEVKCYNADPEKIDVTEYTKITKDDLEAMGDEFSCILPALRDYARCTGVEGTLIRLAFPGGFTSLHIAGAATRIRSMTTFNPSTVLMCGAMSIMIKKLDTIEKKQQEILDYLKLRDKAVLKGNLSVLKDILAEYRYNHSNQSYKDHKHIQVQEIKREAEQSIILFCDQIELKATKKQFLHSDYETKAKIEYLKGVFKDFELAMYTYAFSSFVEIMLLGNFDEGYLDSVTGKIEHYSEQYRELYVRCREFIEKDSGTSIRAHVLKGFAVVNKYVGDTISDIKPLTDMSVDKKLHEMGEKVTAFNDKQTETTAGLFITGELDCIRPFVENIAALKRMYSKYADIVFDEDGIYFGIVKSGCQSRA